jgi:signal transduction histidine kinase
LIKNKNKKMTSSFFEYKKPKVIQALRYHFISRKEIKVMVILINVFAIFSASLFYLKKVSPAAFLLSSVLWFFLMVLFWFLLPTIIYKRSRSFKDRFRIIANDDSLTLEHERASKQFRWAEFSTWMESPHFFHIYFNSTSFFLIPKDAFVNDEENEARKIFASKIKKQ